MRQRWDADGQRWVDDDGAGGSAGRPGGAGPARDPEREGGGPDGAGPGGAARDPQQQWWASAQTQSAVFPQPPPPPPPQGQPQAPPQPQPPYAGPQSWGAPVPGTGPPPPGPGSPRRLLLVIVAVALLAGGVGGGVWALNRDDSTDRAGGARSSVTVTATQGVPSAQGSGSEEGGGTLAEGGSPTASPSASPSPGYSRSVDAVGYTVDVPEGWVRSVDRRAGKPSVVHYTAPGGGAELELFEVIESSPADSLYQAENDPSFGFVTKLAGYRVLDRQSGDDWAEIGYRYDDVQDGALQVVDHRFQAADGTAYAIRSVGAEGTDVLSPLRAALSSFCPTGASCPSA
ncbi:hypothetical protein ACWERY_15255 [Streptomyces sp. NPDC004082]|uniref:hypothetical protein n=2 Tax=Streptomyces TaxID=1883 RepID=UPI0033BE6616